MEARPIRNPGTSAGNLEIGVGSDGAEVFRAGLAAHAVDLRFERKLLAFIERTHAGAFDGADMDEHVVAAVIRLNEAEALCRVEPLNCSGSHFNFSKMRIRALCSHDLRASLIRFQRCLGEGSRFGAINKANDYSNGRRVRCWTGNSKLIRWT